MSFAIPILFNLIVNAVGSFVCALACVYSVLAVFRIGPSRGRVVLLSLPLVKVLWDAGRGIPAGSFLWAQMEGARQELGSFSLGLGLSRSGLLLQAKLGALSGAHTYPQSVAELVNTLLSKKIDAAVPAFIVVVCFAVAAARLAWRVFAWGRFSYAARRIRDGAVLLEARRVGRRPVNVYASPHHAGAPFAAGLLRPYVMIPLPMIARLTPEAREAVVQHELAHIANFDPVFASALALLSDLLWFLPGLRGLLGRFHLLFELRADDAAVAAGADRATLASALVEVGEDLLAGSAPTLGLVRQPTSLSLRVHRLLQQDDTRAPRWGSGHWLGRIAIVLVVALSVLQAIFFGNHS